MSGWSGPAHRLVPGDLPAAAKVLGVPQAALVAVLAVESRGSGFDAQGRPIVLFEPHVFFRQLRAHRPADLPKAEAAGVAYARWGTRPYPKGQGAQFQRLDIARRIDPECAMRAASWGAPQILGENYAAAGYGAAVQMVEAFKVSEQDQIAAMLRLIRAWGLIPALIAGDWARFARRWNGPGQVPVYSARLAAAHRQAVASGASAVVIASPFAPPTPRAVIRPPAPVPAVKAPSRVRIFTADDLNRDELARVRRGASEADDLNAAELARIRGHS